MQLDIHLLQSGLHMLSLLVGALGLTAPKRCCNKSNVPSPNCTRVAGWRCFQGGSLYITSPRAEAPDFAKATSRLVFWRHLPQHEGRHSFSDGGLGYSV